MTTPSFSAADLNIFPCRPHICNTLGLAMRRLILHSGRNHSPTGRIFPLPDVSLLDLAPAAPGLMEVLKLVKNNPATVRVPVGRADHLVCGTDSRRPRRRADRFLTKPAGHTDTLPTCKALGLCSPPGRPADRHTPSRERARS